MNILVQEGRNLQSHAEMIMALSDTVHGLFLFDTKGQLLWSHSRDASRLVDSTSRFDSSEISGQLRDDSIQVRRLPDQRLLVFGAIAGVFARISVILCIEVECTAADNVENRFLAIAELLTRHLDSQDELDSMADELTRRYEELNLIYETDEEITHVSETPTALSGVIENCAEYLNVDLSVLLVGSGDTPTAHLHKCIRNGADDTVLTRIHAPLMNWITANCEPVVANSVAELQRLGIEGETGHKIVASPVSDANGRVLGALVVLNRSERPDFENGDRSLIRVMGRRVSKIMSAEYDSMTGLMNRETFSKTVARSMRRVTKKQINACLLHVNIDRMQLVNDALGHDAGDKLITEVADMIRAHLRDADHIARIGGDEFGILLENCEQSDALKLANRLGESVTGIVCAAGGQKLDVGVSTGLIKLDENVSSVIDLLAAADLACAAAKDDGRGRTRVFNRDDREMQDRATHMRWVSNIQNALKNDRFVLFSQEIAPVNPARHAPHYEVLLRMLDEQDKILSPAVFMPVAERYHMMPEVDCWVIEHAFQAIEQFSRDENSATAVFAINLSGLSLTDRKTLEFLLGRLRECSFDTSNICFEITERAAITNLASAQKFIACVKNFGCKFALDDFGAGVSSFANLRALDLDYVKIDGSFVTDMTTDPICDAMVTSINQVGQTMKLDTVAEFVETPETEARLRAIGVNFLQGYGIAKPRPFAEQLADLISTQVRSA